MDEKLSSLLPLERAAQLWCDPRYSHIEMDEQVCEAIALAIATAEQEAHAAGRKAERERCAAWLREEYG